MDEAQDIVDDHPSLLDRRHDGRKIIVGDDHGRCTLCDLGAADAHGNADVGLA